MLVKEVINTELLTIAEAKKILNAIRDAKKADEELGYAKRRAIEHVNRFAKVNAKVARKMIKELSELEKVRPELAVRIVDIMPQSKDEVRSIYAKERFTLTDEELESILEIVSKNL